MKAELHNFTLRVMHLLPDAWNLGWVALHENAIATFKFTSFCIMAHASVTFKDRYTVIARYLYRSIAGKELQCLICEKIGFVLISASEPSAARMRDPTCKSEAYMRKDWVWSSTVPKIAFARKQLISLVPTETKECSSIEGKSEIISIHELHSELFGVEAVCLVGC